MRPAFLAPAAPIRPASSAAVCSPPLAQHSASSLPCYSPMQLQRCQHRPLWPQVHSASLENVALNLLASSAVGHSPPPAQHNASAQRCCPPMLGSQVPNRSAALPVFVGHRSLHSHSFPSAAAKHLPGCAALCSALSRWQRNFAPSRTKCASYHYLPRVCPFPPAGGSPSVETFQD